MSGIKFKDLAMVSTQNVMKYVHSFQYLLDVNVNKYGNNIALNVCCVTCT
jgi:hypothetical protein